MDRESTLGTECVCPVDALLSVVCSRLRCKRSGMEIISDELTTAVVLVLSLLRYNRLGSGTFLSTVQRDCK